MIKQMIAGVLIAGLSSITLADHRGDRFDRGHGHGKPDRGQSDYARVVDVDPIIQTLTHRVPRETCWTEQVRYEEPASHRSSTPVILGGLIGAAIGNNLGRGHHKDNRAIKTVALGALGASIGNDLGRRHSEPARVGYRDEQRCEVSYDTRHEEQVMGYRVTYRYRGETYRTRMDYDPGERIKVNVKVSPVM